MVQISSFASIVGLLSMAIVSEGRSTVGNHRIERRAGEVTPTAPGPGAVFKAGGQCPMEWTVGSSSKWKSMTIDLMTGANQNMVKITNVASGIDGTSESSHSWTCPEVTPNAPIYFYQFTDSNGANPTWTTRFTIASDDGSVVSAPNATQPGSGQAIPWGIGQLSSGSSSSTTSSNSNSEDGESTSSTTTSSASSSESNENDNQSQSSSSTSSSSSPTNSNMSTSSMSKTGSASMNKVQIGALMSSIAVVVGSLLI